MLEMLTLGYGAEDLILTGTGIAAFTGILVVWFALLEPKPIRGRIKRLEARRAELRGARLAQGRHHMRSRGLTAAAEIVRRLRLLQSNQARKIGERLSQAGWRTKDAINLYLFAKVCMPIIFGIVAVILLYGLQVGELPLMQRALAALGAVFLGAYAPEIYIHNTAQKRRKVILKAMPDGLDLMVICAEAGLSLDATLERVGRELRGSWPEFADEITLTSIELGFMPERRMALVNFAKRVPLPGAKALVNTLLQTERYGTPLATALRVLSAELRVNRLMKAEEKAARLPAIMTVPMILFILPALFVVLIGPGALNLIDGLSGVLGGL